MAATRAGKAPRVRWLGRMTRGLRPDRNPLRRTADRAESFVLAGLLAAFLAGAPFAAQSAGHWAHGIVHQAEKANQASAYRVLAVTLRSSPAGGADARYAESQVPARWTAPGGSPRTGQIFVPGGTAAGSTIGLDGQVRGPGQPSAAAREGLRPGSPGHGRFRRRPGVRCPDRRRAGPPGPGQAQAGRVGCRLVRRRAAVDKPAVTAVKTGINVPDGQW